MKFDENELLEKMVEHNAIMRDIEITQPHTLSLFSTKRNINGNSLVTSTHVVMLCHCCYIFFNNLWLYVTFSVLYCVFVLNFLLEKSKYYYVILL
jgi:hypothetical protein